LFLGVHELPVELMLWIPIGLAIAWSSASYGAQDGRVAVKR